MALGFPEPISKDDERLAGHETDYRASAGGWYPPAETPVPGTPLEGEREA